MQLINSRLGFGDLRVPKYATRDATFEKEIVSRLVRLNAVRANSL